MNIKSGIVRWNMVVYTLKIRKQKMGSNILGHQHSTLLEHLFKPFILNFRSLVGVAFNA